MKRLFLAIGTIAYALAFGAETARAQQEHVPRVSLETAIMNTVAEFSPGFGSRSSMYKHRNYLTVSLNETEKLSCRLLLP